MKSIIQKGIIPARTQSQDKKFQANRPCEVCCLRSFLLELSSCHVITKTAINHRFFSIKSEVSGWI